MRAPQTAEGRNPRCDLARGGPDSGRCTRPSSGRAKLPGGVDPAASLRLAFVDPGRCDMCSLQRLMRIYVMSATYYTRSNLTFMHPAV